MPDQVYLWEWPQWIALVVLTGALVVQLRDRLDHFGDADRATMRLVVTLLWWILLAAGGFWS